MNQYLSNTMPELTEQELKCKGIHTVSYYDWTVASYVAAQYQSIYAFILHAGLSDTQNVRDFICRQLAEHGSYTTTLNGKEVSIYDWLEYR